MIIYVGVAERNEYESTPHNITAGTDREKVLAETKQKILERCGGEEEKVLVYSIEEAEKAEEAGEDEADFICWVEKFEIEG